MSQLRNILDDTMSQRSLVNIIVFVSAIFLSCLFAVQTYARTDDTPLGATSDSSPLYLLTYDHGGLVLWGGDHFVKHLRNAVEWLDRYPSFKRKRSIPGRC